MVRIEVVHVNVGHKERRHLSICERCPVEVTEPGMLFQLRCSILVANAVGWLALEALVDKISGLLVPAIWYAEFFDLGLAREYIVPYLLPSLALVRAFSHHALVPDDSHRKVIRSQPVVLPAHDFGCHVARRSTRLTRIVGRKDARNSKISQAQVSMVIEYQILRLNISVDDLLLMDGFQSVQQARDEEARNFHVKEALASDVVSKVATEEQVHDQVQIHGVLECIVHIDDELAVDLGDQFELVHDARYAFLGDNPRFRHLLHGVLLRLCFL